MATKRMLPHTVTIFTAIGEDEQYHTHYETQVYKHVYCRGITESYSGERPSNPVTAYFFDSATTNILSLNLKGDGKECMVIGDASDRRKPPENSLCIRKVIRRRNGTRRMWHWEVHAE